MKTSLVCNGAVDPIVFSGLKLVRLFGSWPTYFVNYTAQFCILTFLLLYYCAITYMQVGTDESIHQYYFQCQNPTFPIDFGCRRDNVLFNLLYCMQHAIYVIFFRAVSSAQKSESNILIFSHARTCRIFLLNRSRSWPVSF